VQVGVVDPAAARPRPSRPVLKKRVPSVDWAQPSAQFYLDLFNLPEGLKWRITKRAIVPLWNNQQIALNKMAKTRQQFQVAGLKNRSVLQPIDVPRSKRVAGAPTKLVAELTLIHGRVHRLALVHID
jgi:hypothetical protein